jgi:acyl-CoA reductase-like NAD-dependent aldehyde dehydrogenase
MTDTFKTISPIDGSVCVEREYASGAGIARAIEAAAGAGAAWRQTPIETRAQLCSAAIDSFVAMKDGIAEEISRQMGRPIRSAPGEVGGFEERARHMIAIAGRSLADIAIEPKDGFTRFIRHEPLGVVFVIAPWNYPFLTAVNSIVPALMAGNTVILKHSKQTPLAAERLGEAFQGLPPGVFQYLHLTHADTESVIASDDIGFVAFTGSERGGAMVETAVAGRFIGVGLELGGKDPAYVRADADIGHAVENLTDGAYFNSGQSCCGVERIYVHADVYGDFVDGFAALARGYRLGDPLDPDTTLGPMVNASAADFARGHIEAALAAGATALIDAAAFPADQAGTPYLAPQALIDVDHSMAVMTEETFGPVAGIMKVSSDEEAIGLMNDSPFGLTASVWTRDEDAALAIGAKVDTGTWFMNRCDYLDPALAWTGVKNSGRGCTLSDIGYGHLTRPKSFHLRHKI